MKHPTRPTLDTLPPGVQRLTVDGKREYLFSHAEANALCDYFDCKGDTPPERLAALRGTTHALFVQRVREDV